MITAKASGKLYLAGEYAVVEKGNPAIIASVDKYVSVSITKTKNEGTLNSNRFTDSLIHWTRENDKFLIDSRDSQLEFIISAIHCAEIYAKQLGKKLSYYNIDVSSQLDSEDGKKFGLGSSAAVTVATIKALCKFYDLNVDNKIIFKLSALAHLKVQGNGSLGDIAASTYGGIIYYTSPDKNWIINTLKKEPLFNVIHKKWPDLTIQQIRLPIDSKLLIGWTGNPASTSILVEQISYSKSQKAKLYNEFLKKSKQCLELMLEGFLAGNLKLIQEQIKVNRNLLNSLSTFTDVLIETQKLTELCDIATTDNSAAKTSGAGGGDCGIVIAKDDPILIQNIIGKWKEKNIIQLKLNITDWS
ncbi:phosphomevalonate kinase [Companilactobacillus sp. DQM5]|uniref:phosphomevalonate kinase n=1 Tax=Companilactobacillus sp. DQM5 TaxID=3463359 RepID=UPI00405A4520